MSVDVILDDDRWSDIDLPALAEQAAKTAFTYLGLDAQDWEFALLATNDAKIASLNADFRNKDQATNVLSWPSAERGAQNEGDAPPPPQGDPELGDIALSYETCTHEAQDQERPLAHHVQHLVVHGLLHLLGYDHIRDKDADLMESIEIAILSQLGVPNPYL